MPNRREVLKGAMAAGGVAAAGGISTSASANWGMTLPSHLADFDGSSLVHRPHADRVLADSGLDGLVAMNPVNVFYLGNHVGYNVKIQQPNPSFVVYPKDPKKSPILVAGFGDLWNLSNEIHETPDIIPYSAPLNWQDYLGQSSAKEVPDAAPGFSNFFQMSEETLSDREKRWLEMDRRLSGEFMPTPQHALVKALKEAGLDKAKVAVDDLRIETTLKSAGHDSTVCIDGDNVFRKIRVVKSAVEIAHMRRIAQINQAATMNALRQVDVGATNADIDNLFRVEAAKLGAVVTWAVAGSIGGLPGKEVVEGESFLVDSVSQINYYHGDFGRSVVVGEPSNKLNERTRLLKIGWAAALEIMRPGVAYSDIQAAATKAMKGASGLENPNVLVVPHSVGLQHTDEPYRDNLPFVVKDDLVLQEGMTMTVDFPSLEMGWGNCHLEDLVVITKDGVEPLGTIDDPLVVI